MFQDTNGKTGYKNMQGTEYLYGNMKLLNNEERAKALADGIVVWIKPPSPPESPAVALERAKEARMNLVRSLYEAESLKSVTVAGVTYKGGYDTVSRIDSARRLIELKAGNTVTVHDSSRKPVTLNPAEIKAVILSLGEICQTLYAVRQALLVSIEGAIDLQAVKDIIIPWEPVPEEIA